MEANIAETADLLQKDERIIPNDIIFQREVFPTAEFYAEEELEKIMQQLPDYNAEMPSETPKIIHPTTFAELKEHERELQSCRETLSRDELTGDKYKLHKAALKDHEVQILPYIEANLMKGNAYTLVHENFNHASQIEDMVHNVLWMNRDDYAPKEVAIMVLDALRALGKKPENVVLVEKLAKARELEGEHIEGLTPSVPGLRHMHIYTKEDQAS